jgi:hypothetical protein
MSSTPTDTYLVKTSDKKPHRIKAHGWEVSSAGLKLFRETDAGTATIAYFLCWDWFKLEE